MIRDWEGRGMDEWQGEFTRIFTLTEACALLPTIKDQFRRFHRAREAAVWTAEELEAMEGKRTRANTLEFARPLRARREALGALNAEMREAVSAVQDLGVVIKRLSPALIDFPSVRGDRVIFLCWQDGEETIRHWHEIDAGFAGRRPL
ncbi:MAG TPA: DUF2203 domain-containing protein [Chloroflexota bacterium]|nr:DUF2203 domain-containing protein [Chloroflexota bacterium]